MDEEFEFSAGNLALNFANTVCWQKPGEPRDQVPTYVAFIDWAATADIYNDREVIEAKKLERHNKKAAREYLERAVSLRQSIYEVFLASARRLEPKSSDLINISATYAQTSGAAVLKSSGKSIDWVWHGYASSPDRALWKITKAAVDLLTCKNCGRVRECQFNTCAWLFLDKSKNKSRRWCSMTDCGNRAKARRYYRKQKLTKSASII